MGIDRHSRVLYFDYTLIGSSFGVGLPALAATLTDMAGYVDLNRISALGSVRTGSRRASILALEFGLKTAQTHQVKSLLLRTDNYNLLELLRGRIRPTNATLVPHYEHICHMWSKFKEPRLEWSAEKEMRYTHKLALGATEVDHEECVYLQDVPHPHFNRVITPRRRNMPTKTKSEEPANE